MVDTNILVYAMDAAAPLHLPCRRAVEQWRAQPSAWFLSWGIVYEFLRVCTHPRVLARPLTVAQAWSFVESLLCSPGLRMLAATDRHAEVAGEVIGELPHLAGNIMHDAETAILMREHGVRRIYTRDMDFHRFPFLEVIDPAA